MMPFPLRLERRATGNTRWGRRAFLALTLGLLALMAAAGPSHAAPRLTVHLGFQGRFKLDAWVPVTVLAENPGQSFRGTLEVRVHQGSQFRGAAFQADYVRQVMLPAGSRKRFTFTIYLDSFSQPVRAVLREGERQVARSSVDLREHFTTAQLIVVISDSASADFLGQFAAPRYVVTYPHVDLLPTAWHAYDGVAVVVVHHFPLRRIGDAQFEALERWVAQGGALLFAGDVGMAPPSSSVQRLLPVEVLGVAQVNALPRLEEQFNQPLHAARPMLVTRARLTQGEAVVTDHGMPIFVRSVYQRGRVYFFALNLARYPISGWAGRNALWGAMLPAAKSPRQHRDTFELFDRLFALPLSMSASLLHVHLLLFALLAGYLGALAGVYWFLHRHEGGSPLRQGAAPTSSPALARLGRQRRMAAWIAVAAPVVFTMLAPVAMRDLMDRDQLLAFVVSTVEVTQGQHFALLEGHWGIFATRHARATIRSQASHSALRQLAPTSKRRDVLNVRYTAHHGRIDVALRFSRWSARYFKIATQLPARVPARAAVEGERLRITVSNELSSAIASPFVVAMGSVLPLPTLQPGQSVERRMPVFREEVLDEVLQRTWDGLFFRGEELVRPSDEEMAQRAILEVLFPLSRLRAIEQRDELLLIGWLRTPLLPFELDVPHATVRRFTLLIAHVPMRGFVRAQPEYEGF